MTQDMRTTIGGRAVVARLYDSPAAMLELLPHAKLGSWTGARTREELERDETIGRLDLVAKSDALLDRFSVRFPSRRRRNFDDVCGAVPIVPAFIAGQPCSMRRREPTRDVDAPVALVLNTVLSAGCEHDVVIRRGVAVLALARMLHARRPVELWQVCELQVAAKDAGYLFCRLDLATVDLAICAQVLAGTSHTRGLGYGAITCLWGSGGGWAFNNHDLSIRHFPDVCRWALPHVQDVLAIPGVHIDDPLSSDPDKWIVAKLAELTGEPVAA